METQPESVLPNSAFECSNGDIVGIRVPAIASSEDKFHLLKRRPSPNIDPVSCYLDVFDERRQFLVFPPIAEISDEWRLAFRMQTGDEAGDLKQRRVFSLGVQRPCAL